MALEIALTQLGEGMNNFFWNDHYWVKLQYASSFSLHFENTIRSKEVVRNDCPMCRKILSYRNTSFNPSEFTLGEFFIQHCCVVFLEPTLSIVKKAKQKENFPLEPGWTHLKALSESLMDYAAMLLGFLAGQSAPISFRLPLAIKFPPLLLLKLLLLTIQHSSSSTNERRRTTAAKASFYICLFA